MSAELRTQRRNALTNEPLVLPSCSEEENMQKCIASGFTPCCAELISFSAIHVCPDLFTATAPSHKGSNEYGLGYLVPFTKERWEEWHRKYALQSGIDFTIGTGKQSNSKDEHGVAYINGSKSAYQIAST